MDTSLLKLLTDFGPAGALVIIVYLFLRFQAREQDTWQRIVGNHLSQTREEHKNITEALQGVKDALMEVVIRTRSHSEE